MRRIIKVFLLIIAAYMIYEIWQIIFLKDIIALIAFIFFLSMGWFEIMIEKMRQKK